MILMHFVIQEAIRNKLIPLISDKLNVIEHIKVLNNNLCNIICKKQDEVNFRSCRYHKKIIFLKKTITNFREKFINSQKVFLIIIIIFLI